MKLRTIGVVGFGRMGRGIAASLLVHGFEVVGFAPDQEEHDSALSYLKAVCDGERCESAAAGRNGSTACLSWKQRLTQTCDYADLGDCDFIIESVIEESRVKQRVFDRVEAVVGADVVIASNTSAIPISALQAGREHPHRFVGMHWAEPVHLTRFLELVRGEMTSDAAMRVAEHLGHRLGKDPVLMQKDVPAFIANRLVYAMFREAFHLLETGVADAESIDRAFRSSCGLWAGIFGPFRWVSCAGLVEWLKLRVQ